MSTVEVAKLGISDLDTLMTWRERVLRDVFELDFAAPIDSLLRENRLFYERHLADGSHIAGLALLDGHAVGCGAICLYDEMPSPDNANGRCAYVMNVYTVPEARGCGIARAVISWLIDQAKQAGAGKIYLETTDAAHHLYVEAGFGPMTGYLKLDA